MVNKIKVLIVDDEPLARRGIRQLLETETDFEIVGEAKNGREAVASVERFAPELVFLDIQMPLLDGFSFVEKLGARNLPEIIFVTAYDEHAIHAFETGAIDYLLKPINAERFQKTLERVRRRLPGEGESLENKLANLLNYLKIPFCFLFISGLNRFRKKQVFCFSIFFFLCMNREYASHLANNIYQFCSCRNNNFSIGF